MNSIYPPSPFYRYVLAVVLDPESGFVLGLTKLKGPQENIGKINFLGGKIEPGETPQQAAAREVLEEAGIVVPAQAFTAFDLVKGDTYEMHLLAAHSSQVLHAMTREIEPIWQMSVTRHLEYCRQRPELYATGFHAALTGALKALGSPAA